MKLVESKNGASFLYEGSKGKGIITKNFGCRDKRDYFEAAVMVNGKYKHLCTRATYEKACAMVEANID